MNIRWKLGHKITLLWLASIGLSMALVGVVFVYMVKDLNDNAIHKSMSSGFNFILSELEQNDREIASSVATLVARRAMIASANMISSYQDIDNYSPIIFDVEKDTILDQIQRYAKSADLDLITVFDADWRLLAFYSLSSDGSVDSGFTTYIDGQAFIKETMVPSDKSLRKINALPLFVTEHSDQPDLRKVMAFRDTSREGLLTGRLAPLVNRSNDGGGKIVGFVKVGRLLGAAFAEKISANTGFQFGLLMPDGYSIGQLGDEVLDVEEMDLPELKRSARDAIEVGIENETYVIAGHSQEQQAGQKITFLLGKEKQGLTTEVTAFRNASFVVLAAVTLIIAPFGIFYIGHFISSPINRIVSGFENLRNGEYALLDEVAGNDEMNQMTVSFNITSQTLKKRERELQRLSTGIELSPVLVIITDHAGLIEYVNPKFEEVTGYDLKSVLGKTPRILKSDQASDKEYAEMWELLSAGNIWKGEFLNKKKNGDQFWESRSITPIRGKDGKIDSYLSVGEDITERKQSEQEIVKLNQLLEQRIEQRTKNLRERESLNRQILFSAGEGIFGLDTLGNTSFVNPAASLILGYREDELIGREMHALIHHSYPDGSPYSEDLNPMKAAFTDGEVRSVNDEVFWTKAGHPVAVHYTSTPIFKGDEIDGAVITFNDITETKKRELELKRSNTELQDFAYAASHDLQEPLRKIQSFSERLEVNYSDKLDDKAQLYLDRIVTSATRMRQLIDDLLNYSRITTKPQPFQLVDFGELLGGVLDDLETSIDEAGASINVGDIPAIEADPTQIRQLMQNIISNSIKFRREEERLSVEISGSIKQGISSGTRNSECEIVIRDNGIGFEAKFKDRIFGVFERLHGRGEYPGTGIGLATCRKIVERHGGSIDADGVPGEGTTFTITLPIKQNTGERT